MLFDVYIVKCSDGSFYTGFTNDLLRRLKEHNSLKRGAKYTRFRQPVKLVYFERFTNKHDAMVREIEIKKLSHNEKSSLANLELTKLLDEKFHTFIYR